MKKVFCPFINGDCEDDCVFNNGFYDEHDPNNCNLVSTMQIIHSFHNGETKPLELLESINDRLVAIESNTSSDQTESYDILISLNQIKAKIFNE